MMGPSRSTVGVVGENGWPNWSTKMVDGSDVGGRGSELLSWFVVGCIIFVFGIFPSFYRFWVTVKVVI